MRKLIATLVLAASTLVGVSCGGEPKCREGEHYEQGVPMYIQSGNVMVPFYPYAGCTR